MATKLKSEIPSKQVPVQQVLFKKENYILMLAGLAHLAIGFILMAGGKSTDPKVFDPKVVYSTTRITVAPILIILGLIIEVVAIMKNSKSN
jgi:hypothetical protein